MRHVWVWLFLLVTACAAPTSDEIMGIEARHVPAPVPVSAEALEALRTAMPLPAMRAMAAPLPVLGQQVLVERQLSVTIRGHLAAQQARNRNWLVATPREGVTVVSAASSVGVLASAWNLPATNNAEFAGLRTTFPRVAHAGDALILCSGSEGGNPEGTGSGPLDEGLGIVFVPYDVDVARVGPLYCPSPVGDPTNPLVAFLRGSPLPEALTDFARLPSVVDVASLYRPIGPIDPSGWGATPPSVERSLPLFRRWAGDVYGEWWEAGRVPFLQGHQGYGTAQAAATSDAMLLAVSTLPLEVRRALVHALVQRGLDSLCAAVAGRRRYPLGGHNVGWKPPVVLMGHLWGLPIFADPTPVLGRRWPEDDFKRVVWWWGGWDAAWPFSLQPGWDGTACALPPAQWGDPYAPDHSTIGWAFRYWTQAGAAQIGSIAACEVLGESEALNPWALRWARQFIVGPPAHVDAELAAVGIGGGPGAAWWPNWGQDYGGAAGFAAAAFRKYALR